MALRWPAEAFVETANSNRRVVDHYRVWILETYLHEHHGLTKTKKESA